MRKKHSIHPSNHVENRRSSVLASAVLCSLLALYCAPSPAHAQAAQEVQSWQIQAGSLDAALVRLGEQARVTISYPPQLVEGKTTAGISGAHTPREALERLLSGTGLTWDATDDSTFVLKRAPEAAPPSRLQSPGAEASRPEPPVTDLQEVIVTGTRLMRTNLDSPTPVMSMNMDEIRATGKTVVGDVISSMPQFSPRLNSIGSVRAVGGTAGVNQIDFRSLGVHRTLVLVDGRRHVGFGASGSVDMTSIPTDIVERVEIISGGASAVYGADAVAGVVNFITRKDFDGITGRVQAGWNEDGKAGNMLASFTAGRNFHEGRGNAVVSVEYGRTERMMLSEADHARNTVFTPNPENGDTIGPDGKVINDGIPDYIFVDDARLGIANEGGVIGHPFFGALPSGNVYHFGANGEVLPYDWMGRGLYAGGVVSQGGDGAPFFDPYIDLQPEQRRGGVNALVSYEFSPAFELFGEVKYTDVESTTLGLPPILESDGTFLVRTDNAFMPEPMRQELLDYGLTGALMSRFNAEFRRGERNRFKTSRAVVGARGDVGANWRYDLSLVHGRSKGWMGLGGIIDMPRFQRAVDAVTDTAGVLGAPGAAVCRATLQNALSASPSTDPSITGCVAANVFGPNNISLDARAYLSSLGVIETDRRQTVASFFMTGSTRDWLELQGGPVGVAFGFEYRDESFASVGNEAQTNFVAAGFTPTAGSFNVSEAFLELSAPLLADLPLVHDLTLDAAVRTSSYNTIGTTTSWKTGLVWSPFERLRLRGTVATAVRAPHINELFQPRSRGVNTNQYDPCSLTNIGANPNRAANCAALGVPAGFADTPGSRFYSVLGGGNPDLEEESTDTFTAGFTVQPIDSLALTVDYWSIKIENVINSFSTLQILNACVDGPTLNEDFCSAIERDLVGSATVPAGGVTSIDTFIRNGSFLETSGVDFEAAYRMPRHLSGADLRLRGTYLEKYVSKPVQGSDLAASSQQGTGGMSRWRLMFDATWRWDSLSLNYGARYASSTLRFPRETYVDNEDQIFPAKRGASLIHDMRAAWRFRNGVELYFGVNNLLDEDPPRGASESQSLDRGYFDPIGRFFYSGLQIRL